MSIALITPLRDERENIDPLFEAISSQTATIDYWLILENNSTDGSKEYLSEKEKPPNVEKLEVLSLELNGGYQLGLKYSSIIKYGMDHVSEHFPDFDYLGILDSDCFPEPKYYSTLLAYMEDNPDVGIVSGIIYEDEKVFHYSNHPRGGCRIWRRECFTEAGYIVSMSADSISGTLARIKGWKTISIDSTYVKSRKVGKRVSRVYSGKANYYKGIRIDYAGIKFFVYLFRLKPVGALQYLYGYLSSMLKRADRIENLEVREFYRKYLFHKIKYYKNRFLGNN